jgi:hypothetical protein
MPVQIKAYECKYGCGKFLRSKSGMYKHEKDRCCWNPVKIACASCGRQSAGYCKYFEKDLFDPKNLKHKCGAWLAAKYRD